MNNLILKGLVEEKFHSNRYRGLLLSELGRNQATEATSPTETQEKTVDNTLTMPEDIFEDIIGHDDVKELLRATLIAEKPVHVLLAGLPTLAKGEGEQPETRKAVAMEDALIDI